MTTEFRCTPLTSWVLVLGLRKGEVLGLTVSDIDLDAAELTVSLQLQRVRRQLRHRETKTDASDATRAALKKLGDSLNGP